MARGCGLDECDKVYRQVYTDARVCDDLALLSRLAEDSSVQEV